MNLHQPICDRINLYAQTNGTGVIKGFEGIPQNFTINIVAFVLVFILFCFIRKKAWNYGRIALYIQKEEKGEDETDYNVWTSMTYGAIEKVEISEEAKNEKLRRSSTASFDDTTSLFDQGYFNWIRFFWLISDKQIQDRAGPDAYQYLMFERHLIVATFLMTVVCIGVIMPVHIYGSGKNVTQVEFVSTTILNLPSTSPLIWIHAMFGFVAFLVIICVIWRYAIKAKIVTIKETSSTLMVEGIPKQFCFKSFIIDHFRKAYPECTIIDVQFAHNVRRLINLNTQRESAIHAKQEATKQYNLTSKRPTMVPRFGGKLLWCCAKNVDVIDYYDSELLNLDIEIQRETLTAYENKIGIAFITFGCIEDSTIVMEDYHTECFMPNYPHSSTLSVDLETSRWTVTYAPHPNVINWENLSSSSRKWYVKAIIINVIVFIFLFLLTTPTYVINILQLNQNKSMNIFFHRYMQSFIMWLISVILPFLVYYSEILIGHWTKTQEHRIVIIKTYIFLIIMVLIFPSLGIASLPAFINWLLPASFPSQYAPDGSVMVSASPGSTVTGMDKFLQQWLCIYAPGNCAFFVNYVITTAFLGSIAELVRIPELAIYFYHQIVVKSSVEMWGIRQRVLWEFQFGLSYSWLLCVLAVMTTYSVICPLVVPFGWLYLTLRYAVDRYNMYFAYCRSFIDARIHRLALAFTVFSFLLLQVNLLVYMKVKGTRGNLIYVFMLICFLLSFILFTVLSVNGWFTQTKTRELVEAKPSNPASSPVTQFMHPLLNTIAMTTAGKSPFNNSYNKLQEEN